MKSGLTIQELAADDRAFLLKIQRYRSYGGKRS